MVCRCHLGGLIERLEHPLAKSLYSRILAKSYPTAVVDLEGGASGAIAPRAPFYSATIFFYS